jgi:cytochrome oxidase assembly protein ShyY1
MAEHELKRRLTDAEVDAALEAEADEEDGLSVLDKLLEPADVVLGWSRTPEPVMWKGSWVAGTVVPTGELGFKIVADPPLAGLEANAKPDPGDLPNNHLAYAGQWFFFALTALVIYVLALRRRRG